MVVFGIDSVRVTLQTVQVKVVSPSDLQVGSLVTLPESQVWVVVWAISSVRVALQTVQVKVVSPSDLQVGSLVTLPVPQV